MELLAPAGNQEKLETVLHYGADAVYMGISDFSLRARAENFHEEHLLQAIEYVKKINKKIYITTNIFAHNRDLAGLKRHLETLREIPPHAIIVADPGVFSLIKEIMPSMPVHISTQANVTNVLAVKFWQKLGATRVILAREVSLEETKEIINETNIEIEVFVHGAQCIAYSGRCYLSSFMSNRSGNTGHCANSCRWNYTLMEEKRPGEYMPVFENDRGTFIMSSKDLCLIDYLSELKKAGVHSCKIEGRMKGVNYAAGVVKVYREALDLVDQPISAEVKDRWKIELAQFSSRGFSTGMFLGPQADDAYHHDSPTIERKVGEFLGIVQNRIDDHTLLIALRHNLRPGDVVLFLTTGLEYSHFTVLHILDSRGSMLEVARNAQTVQVQFQEIIPESVRVKDIMRGPELAKKIP